MTERTIHAHVTSNVSLSHPRTADTSYQQKMEINICVTSRPDKTHLDSDFDSLVAVTDHAKDDGGEGRGKVNEEVCNTPGSPGDSQPERPHMSLSLCW